MKNTRLDLLVYDYETGEQLEGHPNDTLAERSFKERDGVVWAVMSDNGPVWYPLNHHELQFFESKRKVWVE